MPETSLIIDKSLLQRITNQRKFDIGAYPYIIYGCIALLVIGVAGLILQSVLTGNQTVVVTMSLVVLVVCTVLLSLLWLVRNFRTSFYFKQIATGLSASEGVTLLMSLITQWELPFQQSENLPNVFVCFEYFGYSRSVLETTIVVLDGFLLANTRNQNTSIVSLNQTRLIDGLSHYFKTNRVLN